MYCNFTEFLNVCQKFVALFLIALDTYHHLTDLPAMISDFGLVLIGDSTVYMIGGMDPITFETKDTVFTYDLKTGKWDRFSPLNVAR